MMDNEKQIKVLRLVAVSTLYKFHEIFHSVSITKATTYFHQIRKKVQDLKWCMLLVKLETVITNFIINDICITREDFEI